MPSPHGKCLADLAACFPCWLTVARAQVFLRATSLGGVESLVEHRATIEGPESNVPENLLRLSIGIEDRQELIDDLEHMLTGAV
jgi:cystathionine gamma-synthase